MIRPEPSPKILPEIQAIPFDLAKQEKREEGRNPNQAAYSPMCLSRKIEQPRGSVLIENRELKVQTYFR